ncbi:MAG: histidine kinase [Treponema sp.]|jgi:two-component system sensor histidine kinase YesM|nr:histidine kinase [Treponema sp.]
MLILMLRKLEKIWFSLNGRVQLCLVFSILGMGTVTAFSFFSSWTAAHEAVYRIFDDIENETTLRIEEYLLGYQKTARQAGYSIAVQRFLLSNDPETVIRNSLTAADSMETAYTDNQRECGNICLISYNGRYLAANRSFVREIRNLTGGGLGILETGGRPLPGQILEGNGLWEDSFSRAGETESFLLIYCLENGDNLFLYFFSISNILWINPASGILCVVVCDFTGITESLPGLDDFSTAIAILRYKGIAASQSRELSAGEAKILDRLPLGRSNTSIDGQRYSALRISPAADWDLSCLISEQQILAQVFSRLNNGLLPLCAVMIFSALILILMIRSVNAGITKIVTDLNGLEYSQGLKYRINGPHLREIELISHSVGRLLERLDNSFRREQEANRLMVEAITARAQAEFIGYRAQINPHFLFNTLECVRSMAHKRNDEDMETIISSLASMFRYSLFARPLVPLAQELEHAENFIKVMNIVRGSAITPKYHLKIRVGKQARDFPVPSMILQPLAENSIFHGFFGRSGGDNMISIGAQCDRKTGKLGIRITDNGEGMTEAELTALNNRLRASGENEMDIEGHDALCNIHRRMNYYYKDKFSMIVESKKKSYTRVKLLIPRMITREDSCIG